MAVTEPEEILRTDWNM